MTRRDIPNILSFLRMALAAPVVWLLFHEHFTAALLLFGFAGVSDALDGYLAKRYGWHSRLGSIIDPLADKILLVCTYLALGWQGWLPEWLVAAVIARDLIVVLGALSYHYLIGSYHMTPTLASKFNTFAQIVLAFAMVFSLGIAALPQMALDGMIYLVLITTVASGADYVWIWGRRAWSARH